MFFRLLLSAASRKRRRRKGRGSQRQQAAAQQKAKEDGKEKKQASKHHQHNTRHISCFAFAFPLVSSRPSSFPPSSPHTSPRPAFFSAADEDHGAVLALGQLVHVLLPAQRKLLLPHRLPDQRHQLLAALPAWGGWSWWKRKKGIEYDELSACSRTTTASDNTRHHTQKSHAPRSASRRLRSSAPKRQTLSLPSAVTRRRLHDPQKCCDMDVMKPTRPLVDDDSCRYVLGGGGVRPKPKAKSPLPPGPVSTGNESISQSVNQPTSQPIDQPDNQPVHQSINQPVNQSINQSINQPVHQSTSPSMNESPD